MAHETRLLQPERIFGEIGGIQNFMHTDLPSVRLLAWSCNLTDVFRCSGPDRPARRARYGFSVASRATKRIPRIAPDGGPSPPARQKVRQIVL